MDGDGASHVRYSRTYRGLRVYGGDFVVHTKPDGAYAGMSVGINRPLSLSTTARTPAASAAKTAKATFKGAITGAGTPELFVDASSGDGRLAYETVVRGWAPDGQTPSVLHVITDANTGALIGSFDEVETVNGSGNSLHTGTVTIDTTLSGGTYKMTDPSHGDGKTCDMKNTTYSCTDLTDADNTWGDGTNGDRQSAAVDAHFGAAKTFDYYRNIHGRNGIFGDGEGVRSGVHYGNGYDNAFWDSGQMMYGDGVGNAKPLVSLDIAGHEMSHGVTEQLADLSYSGESGGLNESSSDIFGSMVEFYADTSADPGDYLIAEKVDINGDGTPLRYMYDPALDGLSDGCWSTSTNSVDVHYSSGVGNHFFFNLAEGTGSTPYGFSPVCDSAPAVTGIGRSKAERIWYRALDVYFTATTRYVNSANPANTSRAYTLSAAADLFGLCSTEYVAVQAAWTAVNVLGNDASCPADNDFSLAATPNSGWVTRGGSITSAIKATLTNGAARTVNLRVIGLPSGVTATFNPPTINSDGGTSTLTINTTSASNLDTFGLTIIGANTEVVRSTQFDLTVTVNSFSLSTAPSAASVTVGGSVQSTITATRTSGAAQTVKLEASFGSGVTATFNPPTISSDGGTSTMTISASASARPGNNSSYIYGRGTDSTEYARFDLNVASNDFTLAATPNVGSLEAGDSLTSTVNATLKNGSARTVQLTATGLPSGAYATFSPSTINSNGGVSTLTIRTEWWATVGTFPVTIKDLDFGVNTTFTLTIFKADYSLATSPSTGSVRAGGSVTSVITARLNIGSAQNVFLSASGLPSGAYATFNPSTISSNGGTSTMTITTSTTTPVGTYQVSIAGWASEANRDTAFTLVTLAR